MPIFTLEGSTVPLTARFSQILYSRLCGRGPENDYYYVFTTRHLTPKLLRFPLFHIPSPQPFPLSPHPSPRSSISLSSHIAHRRSTFKHPKFLTLVERCSPFQSPMGSRYPPIPSESTPLPTPFDRTSLVPRIVLSVLLRQCDCQGLVFLFLIYVVIGVVSHDLVAQLTRGI